MYKYRQTITTKDGKRKDFKKKTQMELIEAIAAFKKAEESRVMTFEELANEWILRSSIKPKTRYTYEVLTRCRLLPDLGNLRIDKITLAHLQKVVDSFDFKHSTILNVIQMIKGIFNYAVKRDYIVKSPAMNIETPVNLYPEKPNARRLTPEEEKKVWRLIETSPNGMLYKLLFLTGCRIGEALAIEPDCIEGNILHIRYTAHFYSGEKLRQSPKTKNSVRSLFLVEDLKDLIDHVPFDISYSRAKYEFTTAIGLPLHSLRHNACSKLISLGVDLPTAAALLGDDQKTLLRYYSESSDRQKMNAMVMLAKQGETDRERASKILERTLVEKFRTVPPKKNP